MTSTTAAAGLTRREKMVIAAITLFTAAAGAAHYLHVNAVVAFLIATVALAGLAWIVSFSTEQVGEKLGPAATGVLQSTLGNLPEFFVVIFALKAGETVVAQTSVLGSVFANALLVLGLTLIVGARKSSDGVMRFHPRLPMDTATLLRVAIFLIVLLAVAVHGYSPAAHHVTAISVIGAVCLLVVYGVWLVDYIRADAPGEATHDDPRVPVAVASVLLAVAGAAAAFVSDWFVAALTPAMHSIGISPAFAGLVIVAIAGNAVENVAGLVLASKGQSDLAISVVKNSVSQITVFLFPALVLVSLLFATPLTFVIAPLYVVALVITDLLISHITTDGEATRFEGFALIAAYVILAALTWFS